MFGPGSSPPTVREYLRRSGVAPLVRPTRNQLEVALLPPYGDPEVDLLGEAATYVALGTTAVELLGRLGDREPGE